jgi:hypothetical protein
MLLTIHQKMRKKTHLNISFMLMGTFKSPIILQNATSIKHICNMRVKHMQHRNISDLFETSMRNICNSYETLGTLEI